MSIVFYSCNHPLPLRGPDISNALIELLAVTRWNKFDLLVIDMPPTISDTTLEIIRLVKEIKILLVTSSSQLAFETVKKLIDFLKNLKIPIIGIIENMKMKPSSFIQQQIKDLGVAFWGEIFFDKELEESIGKLDKFLELYFTRRLNEIILKNLNL